MAKKILIVDDETMVVKMLESRLKSQGFDIVTAFNAGEGIEKAQSEQPDLIILDVLMPGQFGNEAAQQLKEDSRTAHIPIIFLSNVPTEFLSGEEKFAGESLQVVNDNVYLSKLCSPEELLEAINRALAK